MVTMTALDGLTEVALRLPSDAVVDWFENRRECSNTADQLFLDWLRMHPGDAPPVIADLESRLMVLQRMAAAASPRSSAPANTDNVYVGSGVLRDLLRSGEMVIEPYDPRLVHVDAVDLRLGSVAWRQRDCLAPLRIAEIGDEQFHQLHRRVHLSASTPLMLTPGAFYVVPTLESITLPLTYAGRFANCSKFARLGVLVVLAEHIHPGHRKEIVLEIKNMGNLTLTILPGDKIGQLLLKRVDGAAEEYGNNVVPFGGMRDDGCARRPLTGGGGS